MPAFLWNWYALYARSRCHAGSGVRCPSRAEPGFGHQAPGRQTMPCPAEAEYANSILCRLAPMVPSAAVVGLAGANGLVDIFVPQLDIHGNGAVSYFFQLGDVADIKGRGDDCGAVE